MRKTAEPSPASLRDIPEVDFSRVRRLGRGKYAARARRSFAVALIEPELFAQFGSSEAVSAALRALVEASKSLRRAPGAGAKSRRAGKAAKRRAA